LLAANPFGCKHETKSGRLGSAGETAALLLQRPPDVVAASAVAG
jgi:hypothetical protein